MIQLTVNPHTRILSLSIDAPLASVNVRQVSDHVSAEAQRAAAPFKGMLLVAAQFPPWRDLSSFLDNLRAVREQKAEFARVAVLTEASPAVFAAALGNYFPNAEIDRFAPHDVRRAEAWLALGEAADNPSVAEAPVADVPEGPADMQATGVFELEAGETQKGEEDDWFV